MAKQVIDTATNHGSYVGDLFPVAFGKANDNFNELYDKDTALTASIAATDQRAVAAKTAADAAVPKAGGEAGAMTGTLVIRGSGTATRRANFYHNANASVDFGAKLTLSYAASTTDLAGLTLVPVGVNGYECQAQVWLKDGDFFNSGYVQAMTITRSAVTFRGNTMWHAGNTTVDANNFIKRA